MNKIVLNWNEYTEAAIKAASEGIVMLENKDNVLPLKKGSRIALFGRMQTHYYKSGTGSGGMVNVHHVTDIREGLNECPDITLDAELMALAPCSPKALATPSVSVLARSLKTKSPLPANSSS